MPQHLPLPPLLDAGGKKKSAGLAAVQEHAWLNGLT